MSIVFYLVILYEIYHTILVEYIVHNIFISFGNSTSFIYSNPIDNITYIISDKTHLKTEPSDTVTYRTVKFYLIVEKCCRVEKSANNNIKSSKGTGYVQLPSGFKFQRFSSSSIAAQQESNRVHVVNNGSIN